MTDDINQFHWVLFLDADWDNIYISKTLENTGFSLHNGHSCSGSDVSESKNGCSICDDSTPVCLHCHFLVEIGLSQTLESQIFLNIFIDQLTDLKIALCLDFGTKIHDS